MKSISILVLALCFIPRQTEAAVGAPAETDPRCGAQCLFVGLAALDQAPASYADLEKAIGEPGPEGYSMHQLEEYARGRGLKTIAVKTSLDHLGDRTERFFCIALLEKGHFVILQDADHSSVRIIDPPRSYALPIDSFRALWAGHALLVGPSDFATEEELGRSRALRKIVVVSASALGIGAIVILVANAFLRRSRARKSSAAVLLACLAAIGAGCSSGQADHADVAWEVDPPHHHLGLVPASRSESVISVRTRITNHQSKPLNILSVQSSCGCTSAGVGSNLLRPGESTYLTAALQPGVSPEARVAAITVVTDSTRRPTARIICEWQAKTPLFSEPSSLDFGEIRPATEHIRDVSLATMGLSVCDRCVIRVETLPPRLIPTLDYAPDRVTAVGTNPTDHGSAGDGGSRQPAARLFLGRLAILLNADDIPGNYSHHVLCRLVCSEAIRAEVSIPISWSVVPVLEVSPQRFVFGACRSGTEVEGTILLTSQRGTPFQIHDVSSDDGNFHSEFSVGAGIVRTIKIRFKAPDELGPWRSAVRVTTDAEGGRELTIPVSMLVVKRELGAGGP